MSIYFKLKQAVNQETYLYLNSSLQMVNHSDDNSSIWYVNNNNIINYGNKQGMTYDLINPSNIILGTTNLINFTIIGKPTSKIIDTVTGRLLCIQDLLDNKFQLMLTNDVCVKENNINFDWVMEYVNLKPNIEVKQGFKQLDNKRRSMWLITFLLTVIIIKYLKKNL